MNDFNCKYLACLKKSDQQDLCPECFKVWRRIEFHWLRPFIDWAEDNHKYNHSQRVLLWSFVIDLMLEIEVET